MGAQVRVDEFGYSLEVAGRHGDLIVQDTSVFAPLDVVRPAAMHSLRQALSKLRKKKSFAGPDKPVKVYFAPLHLDHFQPAESCVSSPSLVLEGERLLVRVSNWSIPTPDLKGTRRLLAPFLKRHRASLASLEERSRTDSFGYPEEDEPPYLEVTIDWPTRGRTMGDAWEFGCEANDLLAAVSSGEISRESGLDLLRGGRWDLFKGQPECDWLEAKGEPYALKSELEQFELAKDVAAFANSGVGGVIAIGLKTGKKRRDGDIVKGFDELDLSRIRRQAYRGAVARFVYPRVAGFEVERIEGQQAGKGLALLTIPPQPRESMPFLVKGALSDGKLLGAHVLLPVRREDDTELLDARAIHDRLRLGEQALAKE